MKKSAILTIFKKEIARFFKDKRTLVALLMPGILIYVLYSLMGTFMADSLMPDEDYLPKIAVVDMPVTVSAILTDEIAEVSNISADSVENAKQQIKDEEIDLLVIFPQGFEGSIIAGEVPNVEMFYNSASANSSVAYQTMASLLDAYESAITNAFNVNMGGGSYDLSTNEDLTSMLFTMIMPMLLIMLLFSGCMAVAPESIAGEKERGTIATMLITPAKRSDIAIGKILALSILALMSGASSTIGVLLGLPKLMGDTMEFDGSVYSIPDYIMLAVVILSTVLVFITAISIISAFAKTVKEATTYVTPLMIGSMLIGITGMTGNIADSPFMYLIPVFNSVHSMIGIFSFEPNILNMAITVASNIAITAVGIFVLTRMFNSEKIMFNK